MKTKHTTVRINEDLLDEAKRQGVNLREALEEGLRKKLKGVTCPTCGQKFRSALKAV